MSLRQCTHCVMDASDPDIAFDGVGRCNHCTRAERLRDLLPKTAGQEDDLLARTRERVKAGGRKGEYDCLLGLSGGVDSSYVALLASRLGLRVLAVHFDNGWNTEVAVGNIERICSTLGFELMTYVIDWEEFRDLQRSFLMASVIDVELVTDHAIFAAMLRLAREHDIPHILSGTNMATESILPRAWVWPKQDWRNISAIHRRFGSVPLRTFPRCGVLRWSALRYTPLGPTYVELLNQTAYRRDRAIAELQREVGWRQYGAKHHESVFTRFYQCTILPEKFGVDKRTAHLSSLIVNGELTRDEALRVLDEPLYGPGDGERERTYVLKKLGLTDDEYARIMQSPPRRHDEYPSSAWFFTAVNNIRERVRHRELEARGTKR